MRNCEIKRIKLEDIQAIDGCRFVSVKKSKTPNGVRLAPVHDFVYRKLKAWAVKNRKDSHNLLFDYRNAGPFNFANNELARMLKVSDEELESENITFYSGRHYWKTLMNAEGLGEDIEEIFMGHKVVSNVAKLYNHRDKQGKKMLAKKAAQVFSILDRCIFTKP
jgi:integrase